LAVGFDLRRQVPDGQGSCEKIALAEPAPSAFRTSARMLVSTPSTITLVSVALAIEMICGIMHPLMEASLSPISSTKDLSIFSSSGLMSLSCLSDFTPGEIDAIVIVARAAKIGDHIASGSARKHDDVGIAAAVQRVVALAAPPSTNSPAWVET